MENNNYEVLGVIEEILPKQSGMSKNGFWTSRSFILSTSGKYRNKLSFICWHEGTRKLDSIKKGDQVIVCFYINSKKNKDRWYPDLVVLDINPKNQIE